jgi:O-acetyl-ADP-ribose deacetylase (regulator of RNase III)
MIEEGKGNLLQAEAEALVNTVNCMGFTGKRIALQFKQAFPENYDAYHRACQAGEVRPGRMFVFQTGSMVDPKYIINFPTKRHWRGDSKIEDIETGLKALIEEIRKLGIKSLAVPPLGCGLGGLSWEVVGTMIVQSFEQLPGVRVLLFAAHGAPDAKAMPVHTKAPKMTLPRAMFIKIMEQYVSLAYRLTLLEVQKLRLLLARGRRALEVEV